MSQRKRRGGTLALVAITTVVIVMVGVGLFFIIQAIGGFRELQNATDSGNLNLARLAIKRPSVPLDVNGTDRGIASLGDRDVGGEINLLTYNRLIGQALLSALNAQAESDASGNIPQEAQDNVKQLFDRIQTGAGSLSGQLFSALENGVGSTGINSGYNLKDKFNTLSQVNSTRMNGQNSPVQQNGTTGAGNDYQIGYYLGQNASTNIQLDGANGLLNANNRPVNFETGAPVALPANLAAAGPAPNGRTYVRGYEPIVFNFPAVGALALVGVPVYPGEQPHHISRRDFRDTVGGLGTGVASNIVPPNAMVSRARVNVRINDQPQTANTESIAVVGTMGQTFEPSIPDGYLIIDNGSAGSATGFTPTGSSVLANELGAGILVSGSYPNGVFSINDVAMNAWAAFDHSGPAPATMPANAPPTTGIFNSNGDPATPQQVWDAIPKNGTFSLCDDKNTGSSPCQQMIDPQGGQTQGPFDLAYHRNDNLGGNPSNGGSLIAPEIAKCRVWEAYYVPPFSACVNNVCASYFSDIPSTGLRLFPANHIPWLGQSVPWCDGGGFGQVNANGYSDPNTACKVTTDGTLRQLLEQSFGANTGNYLYAKGTATATTVNAATEERTPAERFQAFIRNRLQQMKPGAGDGDVNRVLDTTIALGTTHFVYVNNSGDIVCTETAPPSHDPQVRPDGTLRRFIRSYDADELITNTQNDNCIHDHHFMTGNASGRVFSHNTFALTPSTGARNGLLGVIQLQCDLGCYRVPGFSGVAAYTQPTGDFALCDRD